MSYAVASTSILPHAPPHRRPVGGSKGLRIREGKVRADRSEAGREDDRGRGAAQASSGDRHDGGAKTEPAGFRSPKAKKTDARAPGGSRARRTAAPGKLVREAQAEL